jgi:hypothetical protein
MLHDASLCVQPIYNMYYAAVRSSDEIQKVYHNLLTLSRKPPPVNANELKTITDSALEHVRRYRSDARFANTTVRALNPPKPTKKEKPSEDCSEKR